MAGETWRDKNGNTRYMRKGEKREGGRCGGTPSTRIAYARDTTPGIKSCRVEDEDASGTLGCLEDVEISGRAGAGARVSADAKQTYMMSGCMDDEPGTLRCMCDERAENSAGARVSANECHLCREPQGCQ